LTVRRTVRLGLFLLIVGVSAFAGLALKARRVYNADHAVGARDFLEFDVRRGESEASVLSRLAKLGIGESSFMVRQWHRLYGARGCIKAGRHQLKLPISMNNALKALCDSPAAASIRVTIKEGENLFELEDRLVREGWLEPGDLLDFPLANSADWCADLASCAHLPAWSYPNRLEGYLYPSTYDLPITHTLETLVRRSLKKHKREWAKVLETVTPSVDPPLNQHKLLTLASIVQREAKRSDEMALIAGVYLNRIRIGMKLQADPTMIYGPEIWRLKPTPTLRRWAANQFNTYAHKGLPPGPIGAISADAMRAVLNPARTDALFFVAKGDGSGRHVFSKTYAEHKERVRELRARRTAKP